MSERLCPGTGWACKEYSKGLCRKREGGSDEIAADDALNRAYVAETWSGATVVSPVACYMHREYLIPEHHVGDGQIMAAQAVDPGAMDLVDWLMGNHWPEGAQPDAGDTAEEAVTKAAVRTCYNVEKWFEGVSLARQALEAMTKRWVPGTREELERAVVSGNYRGPAALLAELREIRWGQDEETLPFYLAPVLRHVLDINEIDRIITDGPI